MSDFQPSFATTLFMCTLYVTLGVVSVSCNVINLVVYTSSTDFRRKFIFFIGLNLSELVNAISYILTGFGRGHALLSGFITTPITVFECFYTKFWPHSLILGTELPAVCLMLISSERIVAVMRPAAYNRFFSQQTKLELLLIIPIFGATSLLIAGLSVLGPEGRRLVATQHCAIITSTAGWYSTFHFSFGVFAYCVAFFSTSSVWYLRRKVTKTRFGGGGDENLQLVMAISASSILLVSLPAIVMISIRWNVAEYSDVTVALTYAMPGFLSVANTMISFSFRRELRAQLLVKLGVSKDNTIFTVVRAISGMHSHSATQSKPLH